jgi:hypothetical protein
METTMFAKTLLAAAALAAVMVGPAHADLKWNGKLLNGIQFNGPGLTVQGISLNGMKVNSKMFNGPVLNGPGVVLQGRNLNGITFNGTRFNGPGLVLQGRNLNGMRVNGPILQGIQFNGTSLPGQQGLNVGGYHGVGLNGQVIAIEF